VRAIGKALDEAAATLRRAGFAADTDPGKLDTATVCVWLQAREVRDYTLGGGATLVAWAYLVAPNTDIDRVLELLDDALEGFLEVYLPADSDDVIDLSAPIVMPSGPNPLPAYRVAIDLEL
jgi:hypothetical protein